jgi:hypothetical protein
MASGLKDLFGDNDDTELAASSNDELHRELAHRALGCITPV